MESYITALQQIIPKELVVLQRRYRVLRGIRNFGPIGRRGLSDKIHVSEKQVRTDTDFFKEEGFIKTTGTGMVISSVGEHILDELKAFIEKVEGLSTIEEQVRDILGCQEVVIVAGDSDEDEEAMFNLGHAAAKVLQNKVEDGDIIAVTGGATVHQVVEAISSSHVKAKDLTVVPARGSLGDAVTYQANTLAAMLSDKLDCHFKPLNVPDNLSQNALESMRAEPEIQNTLDVLVKTNILLFGIGKALKMASRRHLGDEVMDLLQSKKAASEILGFYFDPKGKLIYASHTIGLMMNQMTDLKYPIAVAGGHSKSGAILSVKKLLSRGCVIMDEGAAKGLIAMYSKMS